MEEVKERYSLTNFYASTKIQSSLGGCVSENQTRSAMSIKMCSFKGNDKEGDRRRLPDSLKG